MLRRLFPLLAAGSLAACAVASVAIPPPEDGGAPDGPPDGSSDSPSRDDASTNADANDGGTPTDGDAGQIADAEGGSNPDAEVDAPTDVRDGGLGPVVVRANLNGPDHTGIDYPGEWKASPIGELCGDNGYSAETAIHGTADPALFRNEIFSHQLRCQVGDMSRPLTPGRYRIRLYFAEIYFGAGCPGRGGVGSRVFDVTIENTRVLENFDILAVSGGCLASTTTTTGRPVIREFDIDVLDGVLNIRMAAHADVANLAALEVLGPR